MNEQWIKKKFIWSKGTRGHSVFTMSLIFLAITQVIYYIASIGITINTLKTRSYMNSNEPNSLMYMGFVTNLLVVVGMVLLNYIYISQVIKRARIFKKRREGEPIVFGAILSTSKKVGKYKGIMILSEERGPMYIRAYDKNIFGKNKKSKNIIAVPYAEGHSVAYY